MELVDYEVIDGLSPSAYQAAEPFPHAVLQDLIDPDVLRGIAREFPDPSEMSTQYETALEIKRLLYDRRYTIEGARKHFETRPAAPPVKPTRQAELFDPVRGLLEDARKELREILQLLK